MVGKSCSSCAFVDPEAWEADPQMPERILESMRPGHQPFFCHRGMALAGEEANEYQPPRLPNGAMDISKMSPCAGFLAFAFRWAKKSTRKQRRAVEALQLKMLGRFLRSNDPYVTQLRRLGYHADTLRVALMCR